MPFKKGQSGNPSGRPKSVKEVQDAARKHSADAIKVLVEIMSQTHKSSNARIAAANAILDRAYGKPSQHNINDDRHSFNDKLEGLFEEMWRKE